MPSSSSSHSSRDTSPFSVDSFVSFVTEYFTLIILVLALAGFSFWLGTLWKENAVLRAGGAVGVARPAGGAPGANPTAPAPAAPEGPTADQLAQAGFITEDDYVLGSRDATVVLVEYSDFECPFCARFAPTAKQIVENNPGDVALAYRHYPLGFHPNAQSAAEASECVGREGGEDAFWAYHDLLFQNAENLGMETYVRLANEVGVNGEVIRTCIDNGDMTERVTQQFTIGQQAGVSGTPGTIVFVNGEAQELIPGALGLDQVQATIDQYL